MAQALRGNQPESWPGLVADATVRVLSGREADTLAHLDALQSRADLPASAKPWLDALRLLARQDWRIVQPTLDSPLLLKIVWFRVVNANIHGLTATSWLEKIMPAPPDDPTTPEAADSPWALPDWGRAVNNCHFYLEVDSGHRFTETNLGLEYNDLNRILAYEGQPALSETNIASVFSQPEDTTVSADAQGKPVIHVIGLGTFKAATLRHLYHMMRATFFWMRNDIGDNAGADDFRAKMDRLYRGAPMWDFAFNGIEDNGEPEVVIHRNAAWTAQGRSWHPWDFDATLEPNIPGGDTIKSFYAAGEPFGTVYNINDRIQVVNYMGIRSRDDEFTAKVTELKKLPLDQQIKEYQKWSKVFNAEVQTDTPKSPTPYEQQLIALAPDCYRLVVAHYDAKDFVKVSQRYFDYDLEPLETLTGLAEGSLDDATHEMILRKSTKLNSNAYFSLAAFLRLQGRDDEAAEIDRKGIAECNDAVAMSNSVYDLVLYDLDHGLKDEAEKVAQDAANTGSECGMAVELRVLENDGKLGEAEQMGQEIESGYGGKGPLNVFYVRHRDAYPQQYAAVERTFFPRASSTSRSSTSTASREPVAASRDRVRR